MYLKELHFKLISGLALLIAALFSVGYHHFDEHFQIMEFAALKLGLSSADAMPWEFQYQIRPTLQPSMVVLMQSFLGWFGISDPFFIATLLRLLSAAISLISINLIFKVFKGKIKDPVLQHWFMILSYTLWFSFYIGVRFSSENWSALCFVIGFCLYFLDDERSSSKFWLIGALFGLSFLFRFQVAFMILGFALWLLIIRKDKFLNLMKVLMAFSLIFGLGLLIDRWFYNEWTLSSWNYFTQNIVEDKVSGFGVRPWYWYFTKIFESAVPPLSLLVLLAFFATLIVKPKSAIIWTTLPFLLVHILIGHKELRFLFPLYLFVPIIIMEGLHSAQKFATIRMSSNTWFRTFMKLTFYVNFVLLVVVIFKPADTHIGLYKTIYRNYDKPTVLYYIDDNPYHRVLSLNYYKRDNLEIVQVDSIEDIPEARANSNSLIVLNKRTDNLSEKGEMIYSSFPNWLLEYNFNNWQDRTSAWYVYELK